MNQASLRVMTWNVHGRFLRDVEGLTAEISALSPDIVGLQEVLRHQTVAIARSLGMTYVWTLKHNPWWPILNSRAEGLAIISRHPIVRCADALLSTTTRQRSHRRRVAQLVEVRVDEATVSVINTHLASHDDGEDRYAQSLALRSLIDRTVQGPWLMTADLNDHDEPDIVSTLEGDDASDAWQRRHGRAGGLTCPSDDPSQRLDHIIVSRMIAIDSVDVVTTSVRSRLLSDHLPVVAVTHVLGSERTDS